MKQKNYLNNEELKIKKEKFIQYIKGIGDILVFETKQRNNDLVKDGLDKINNIIDDFLNIQRNDPDRFEFLLLSDDFFKLYQKDEEEAKLSLDFEPRKYLISFSTAINQILRIHNAAIEIKNEEISRFAIYNLNGILAKITQTPNNYVIVKSLLEYIAEAMRVAIKNQDRSMYAASIHWYIDIVFNNLTGKDNNFDLSYLELFDEYFFSSIKYIVSENQTSLFNSMCSDLLDAIYIPHYEVENENWGYVYLLSHRKPEKYKELDMKYSLQKCTVELLNLKNDLYTKENLELWLKKFDELKKIIEPNLDKDELEKAQELEKKIKESITLQFKHKNLLELVFAVGVYCLFKQRYDYIKYLWEYKQPPDADTRYLGHNIIPENLDEAIQLYFHKEFFEEKFIFWEEHHGSEIYYKQYFILLLLYILQKQNQKNVNYNLPDWDIDILKNIEYSMDDLTNQAKELIQNTHLFEKIGFDINKLNELFNDKLIPFFKELKQQTVNQISQKHKSGKISQNKVEEFKENVLKGFYEKAFLRDIFIKYFKSYEDRTKEKILDKIDRIGITTTDDKGLFFEKWYMLGDGFGKNYGEEIALLEELNLINKLSENCEKITLKDFENTLLTFENLEDIVIFASNFTVFQFSKSLKNYKPKWYKNVKQLDIKGFDGWYDFKDIFIPIFCIYSHSIEKQFLILDKNNVGKLIQLSPLNEGENENLVKDFFYINVQAFSENNDLMEQFIKNPPEWLKNFNREQEQREYLQKSVLIQIFERFGYKKSSENFKGYKILLNN